jgi:hypothetical protein
MVSPSSFDDQVAMERGRLMTAQALANHEDQLRRGIDKFGLEYMQQRYPEAFRKPSEFGRILDKLKISLLG